MSLSVTTQQQLRCQKPERSGQTGTTNKL